MNGPAGTDHKVRRIAVALDPACATPGIIEAAADLAGLLGAELEVLFVEDVDIRSLSQLPFARLFEPSSGKMLPFDEAALAARRAGPAARNRMVLRQLSKTRRLAYSVRELHGLALREAAAESSAELIVIASQHVKFGGTPQVDQEALTVAGITNRSVLLFSPRSVSPERIVLVADDTATGRRAARMAELLSRRAEATGAPALERLSPAELSREELAQHIHDRAPSLVVVGIADQDLAAHIRDTLRHETCSLLMVREQRE